MHDQHQFFPNNVKDMHHQEGSYCMRIINKTITSGITIIWSSIEFFTEMFVGQYGEFVCVYVLQVKFIFRLTFFNLVYFENFV